jgi:hypothetical protein
VVRGWFGCWTCSIFAVLTFKFASFEGLFLHFAYQLASGESIYQPEVAGSVTRLKPSARQLPVESAGTWSAFV